MPAEATRQIDPVIHHNKLKLTKLITWPPIIGDMICAADQPIAYNAAYSPRFWALVRMIQNEFINGIDSISPRVMNSKMNKAEEYPGGKKIISINPAPVINTPM